MMNESVPIVEKKTIPGSAETITVRMSESFRFEPGQYVTVTLPQLSDFPVQEGFRDFSVTSSPDQLPLLTITYRHGQSAFKQELSRSFPGDSVLISGPKGVFTLPENKKNPIVFIAGGIGIAPFMSMIRFSLAQEERFRSFTLYFFNRGKESAVYSDELVQYGEKLKVYPNFGELNQLDWDREKLSNALWYIAGPSGMVQKAMFLLESGGVNENQIKTEEFIGYE